jgi:protein-disulfide isomerase
VLVEEFGDYQCGPCSMMGRRLHALIGEEGSRVRLVFRHCPSRAHPTGRRAAIVAAAAEELGSFWPLHWRLVAEGPVRSEEQVWQLAAEEGIDAARLRAVIASGRPEAVVVRDTALADRRAVRGLPTTFVNGRRIEGTASLERLRAVVREARASIGPRR